jgi:hypothetical protein
VTALPIEESDLQEYRAYLQRGETRLSTLHRVAGAFLSGAGLLTLLPLLVGGTFSGLLALILFYESPGLPAPGSAQRWLALAPVLASVGLPLAAMYLLIRDLVLFYFTARTFHEEKNGVIYPRFVLSGILVSESSLRDFSQLERARGDNYVRNLLVPSPPKLKKKILKEAQSIGDLAGVSIGEHDGFVAEELRQYVLRQTGSHTRTLAEESAKMEASIARHLRFLRGLVLRYAKAFLLTIATTVVALAANGVLTLLRPIDGKSVTGVNGAYVWMTTMAIYAGWALVSTIIVRQPVIWLYADSSRDKISRTPRPLLRFEQSTLAVTTLISGIIAIDLFMAAPPTTGVGWGLALATAGVILATFIVAGHAFVSERPEGR